MKKIAYVVLSIWCCFTWFVTPVWLKYTFLNLTGLIYQHDPTMDEGTAFVMGMLMLLIWIVLTFYPNYVLFKKTRSKYMKRISILIFIIAAAVTLTACGKSEEVKDVTTGSAYQKGLEIAALLDEMAGNEDYVQIYTAGEEIGAILEEVASGDHTSPSAVYEISFMGQTLYDMAVLMGGDVTLDGMSEDLTRAVEQKLLSAVISQLNATGGAVNLAAMSVCTAGKTFVSEKIENDMIYLYVYEDAAPVAVTFVKGEDNSVSASGTFLLCEGLNTESEQTISEFFAEIGAKVTLVAE